MLAEGRGTAVRVRQASARDVAALAELHASVARDLTIRHGSGHWSHPLSLQAITQQLGDSTVLVAVIDRIVVGTARLTTKKPWAIDTAYFSASDAPVYVTGMAVDPALQGRGVGRTLVDALVREVRAVAGSVLRLDAYEGPAGAGAFYRKCGFQPRGAVRYRGVALEYFERIVE